MNIIRKARISADKRSVDAYGRSIELAIANYLLDEVKFPTDISQLTIEYTGDEVTYNNVDYYVIKDSFSSEDSVTLLKAEPLTIEEVNQYGAGHANRYTSSSVGTAYDSNGYGGMAYYSSATCNRWGDSSGCTTNYADSEIKYVVDVWKTAQAPNATTARLITLDDLTDNLVMELNKINPTIYHINVTEDTPTWVIGENYYYWTMTTNTDKTADVWNVNPRYIASVYSSNVQNNIRVVRPVITISKTVLSS